MHPAQVAAVVAAVAAVSLAGVLVAVAHPSERVLVAGAVRAYVATSDCCAVPRIAVARIQFAAADPEYAAVRLDGFTTGGASLGSVTAVLQRELGVWHVLALGSSDLGCGIPAARVRAELGVACDAASTGG